jgi:hypothetical protein
MKMYPGATRFHQVLRKGIIYFPIYLIQEFLCDRAHKNNFLLIPSMIGFPVTLPRLVNQKNENCWQVTPLRRSICKSRPIRICFRKLTASWIFFVVGDSEGWGRGKEKDAVERSLFIPDFGFSSHGHLSKSHVTLFFIMVLHLLTLL